MRSAKACIQCGRDFVPRSNLSNAQKMCSPDCAKARQKEQQKPPPFFIGSKRHAKNLILSEELPKSGREARALGLRFYAGLDCTYKHGGIRYAASGDCRDCTRIKNGAKRRQKYRDKKGLIDKVCANCKRDFIPNHFGSNFCSDECRNEYSRLLHREKRFIEGRLFGNCAHCGSIFEKKGKNNIYCSREHNYAATHKKKGQEYKEKTRRALAALKALEEMGIEI